jgi:hypothetical protein
MKTASRIFLFCLVLFSLFSFAVPAISQSQGYTFDSMRFFESGYTAPELGNRIYNSYFPKSRTKYVFCEVYLVDIPREKAVHAVWKFYNPDNTFMGESTLDHAILPGTYYLWHGWGWASPGNWKVGNYRVEVFIDGKKIGQGYFTIMP